MTPLPPFRGSGLQAAGRSWKSSDVWGQAGCPPGVATDAQSGLPVMAYQSAELLLGQRGGSGYVLIRMEGACARAHKAGKHAGSAQRAKVRYCPCCTRPTHIAAPSRYVVGEFPPPKDGGISLRTEHRPWAARCYAAPLYA